MGECASTARPAGAAGKSEGSARRPPASNGNGQVAECCLQSVSDNIGASFIYRVHFRSQTRDHEGLVISTLTELLWVAEGDFVVPAVKRCIEALKKLKALRGDKLQDYVVPVANVVLHAPSQEVRKRLWQDFVLEQVKQDWTLAHLFFWAFRCVSDSPDAESSAREEAMEKRRQIEMELRAKSFPLGLQVMLESANDAVRVGQRRGQVPRPDPTSITPLIDLLNRLHTIGCDIVCEKDKQKRKLLLRNLLNEKINECSLGQTPVPAMMLAPHSFRYRDQLPSSVVNLAVNEARVLSSKERAPYLVLVEVDTHASLAEPGFFFQSRGICCRRASTSRASGGKTNGVAQKRPESKETPEDYREVSLIRQVSCEHKEAVTDKLIEHDPRPKGIFDRENWPEVVERVQTESEHGQRPGWHLISLIVKSNADDVRQEELAYRLLRWFQHVFAREKLKLWLQPFLIVATTHDGGVLETVSNAISLSDLKKTYGDRWVSLSSYFESAFPLQGGPTGVARPQAIMNFIWSMAAYSVVCYVLAIRDRHNGNILIDDEGHILHVDFGFMLCGAPGGKMLQRMGGFEHSQGFKLTDELAEVLNLADGEPFRVFRKAVSDGMLAVRRHMEELLALLQLSMLGMENSRQRCFAHPRGHPEAVLEDICERLCLPCDSRPAPAVSDEEFAARVDKMIDDSIGHWRSRLYDKYQYHFTDVH